MQTETGRKAGASRGAWDGSPIITARNAVTATIGRTKEKLFGGLGALNGRALRGEVEIPNGDIAAFFAPRIARYGIPGVAANDGGGRFDTAVEVIARDLVAKTRRTEALDAEQRRRIALEYVLQSAFLKTDAIVPFTEYLGTAAEFRRAVKAVNAAARASSDEAFTTDGATAKRLNTEGRKGWEEAIALLTASAHLRRLRTTIAAPILYADDAAWDDVKAMDREMRNAVVVELQELVAECGTPIVKREDVARARARVAGNIAFTNGSAYGVGADAVVAAVAATPFARTQNGGARAVITDTSLGDLGRKIAGIRGLANASAERVGPGTVRFAIEVRDAGPLSTSAMIPLTYDGPQQHATA